MPKEELEFINTDTARHWREVEGSQGTMFEKILAFDPESGSLTRLLRFEPGLETDDVLEHDFNEEVYILDGFMTDKHKRITMGKGYYACRPAGMKHGPYSVPFGCTMFEVRSYD